MNNKTHGKENKTENPSSELHVHHIKRTSTDVTELPIQKSLTYTFIYIYFIEDSRVFDKDLQIQVMVKHENFGDQIDILESHRMLRGKNVRGNNVTKLFREKEQNKFESRFKRFKN